MFFIVLDLRLTKVGVQRNSFFYAHFRVVFPFVFVRGKTQVRSIQNALAFEVKRPCVLYQMHLRFLRGCRKYLPIYFVFLRNFPNFAKIDFVNFK